MSFFTKCSKIGAQVKRLNIEMTFYKKKFTEEEPNLKSRSIFQSLKSNDRESNHTSRAVRFDSLKRIGSYESFALRIEPH